MIIVFKFIVQHAIYFTYSTFFTEKIKPQETVPLMKSVSMQEAVWTVPLMKRMLMQEAVWTPISYIFLSNQVGLAAQQCSRGKTKS